MALDPQVEAHYRGRKMESAIGRLPIEEIRRAADEIYNDKRVLVELARVSERSIPGAAGACEPGAQLRPAEHRIPLRIYEPKKGGALLPLLLFFHGGGFVMHNIASHDSLCRKLARECDCVVVSVGYRLAPEHPYPAAVEDGYAALLWAKEHAAEYGADPGRLLVGGDSAGATISAALTFLSRDRKGPQIALQLLYYGSFGTISLEESETVRKFAGGEYVLPRDMLNSCGALYRGVAVAEDDPYYQPGRCRDFHVATRSYVVTAEYDPLRDDGEAFAERLKQAGSEVTLQRMKGMMHGFLLLWDKFDRTAEIFSQTRAQIYDREAPADEGIKLLREKRNCESLGGRCSTGQKLGEAPILRK